MVITDRMEPHKVNGEYCVPIVDNRVEFGGYYTDAWPAWFDNFHRHCIGLAVDYGQVPVEVMNRELRPAGARLVQFDTQDGWMMAWRSPQDYLMFVLRWS